LYDEILDSETMRNLVSLYEESKGISLSEIKEVRKQFSLSMELFARLLGWSKSTVVRYESGKYLPTTAHLFILKTLKDNPEKIHEFYKENKFRFTDQEQEKISKHIAQFEQNIVENGLEEILNANYKIYNRTIESGFKVFDIDKIINMIIFFAEEGVQKTKLMKLLFYSDFLSFKRNLISMSGVPYERLQFGPVPKDHDLLLSAIEKNNYIDIKYEYENEYTYIKIFSKNAIDEELFTEDEKEILLYVKEKFKNHGSVQISDHAHEELGWKETPQRNIISY